MNHNKISGKKSQEFEFCEACRLNHNQGRKHIYFANHKKALSAFLSHFQSKIVDVKFFLKNPIPLRPEHASHNRLWCVFCGHDILELGSNFACANAISHFAGGDHLKKVKAFLWKLGGGMNRVDAFCISDADFSKWQKKCQSLKTEAGGEGSQQVPIGPVNDIHYNLNSDCGNTNGMNNILSVSCTISNDVFPLQNYTDERSQVSSEGTYSASGIGSEFHDMSVGADAHASTTKISAGYMDNQHFFNTLTQSCPSLDHLNNRHVYSDERIHSAKISSLGLPNLTQISTSDRQHTEGNVHSGAPPPWFNGNGDSQLGKLKSKLHNIVSPTSNPGRSSKLNPKRVGAAWAERRKLELELERSGEVDVSTCDPNWLPNFGRVWQSGSRKESRKEFQTEKKTSLGDESQLERQPQLQPYISKRMRMDGSKVSS